MPFSTLRLTSVIVAVYGFIQHTISFALPVPISTANQSALTTSQTTNLTFHPWPRPPFYIPIPNTDYRLGVLTVSSWNAYPAIPLPDLIVFIKKFGDDLERNYPPPGYAPRKAWSTEIDLISYTKWRIESSEGWFALNVHTSLILAALQEFLGLLRRYGPATISGLVYEGAKPPRPLMDAVIDLTIEKLVGGDGLNVTGFSGARGTLETS